MNFEEIKDIDNELHMHIYKRQNICFDRGEGCKLYDTNGREYIDFFSGISVSSLGYNDKELVDAISTQASKLIHCSNYFYSEPRSELMKNLLDDSVFTRVFLANSGAEANECAIKLVRRHYSKKGLNKSTIITAKDSFHGRTLATVTATGQPKYNEQFSPLPQGFKYVPYNDFAALKEAITDDVGAIMLECIQCESGVIPANYDYLVNAYALAKAKDILVILDEVQTGCGRTGKFYSFEHYGIQPDIATLAKGLAGGVPIGACLARGEVADAFDFAEHGTTFGGNPLACAAANVVVNKLKSGGLLEQIEEKGEYLRCALHERLARHKFVLDIRGKGLIQGVELDAKLPVSEVIGKMSSMGVIIGSAGRNTVRLAPPYIISNSEIDETVAKLESIFASTNI